MSFGTLYNSYENLVDKQGYNGPWAERIIDIIKKHNGQSKNQCFDEIQLLKHYCGIMNTNKKKKNLLYLYWHPINEDWEYYKPFNKHEEELDAFAGLVKKAEDVEFYHMSINELWQQWEEVGMEYLGMHVQNLYEKYKIEIIGEKEKSCQN